MNSIMRFSLIWILAIFIPYSASFCQEKDYWLKMERKGTEFGYEHISVKKMENGNFEYRYQSMQKADVVGKNPQDHELSGRYIVDAELCPISFEYKIDFPVKKVSISGKKVGEDFELVIEEEGRKAINKKISSLDFYFDVVLADLIFQNRNQKELKLKILNSFSQKIEKEKCCILQFNADSVTAQIKNQTTHEYCIDKQGQIQRVSLNKLNIRRYLTNAKDAQNITYLKTDDGLSLQVRSNKSFPNVFKVSHAKIEVRWKDVPFDAFNFEDNRQKIFGHEIIEDQYKVELEFTKFEPKPRPLTVPIEGEQFKPFLGDFDFIQPGAASIQQQIAQIQGEGRDAFQIVNDILSWISANIKIEYIAETLTAPEVLERRGGKCAEFAILFASLARAAGIPTKVVLGEANQGSHWVGHLWNEVWIGEWLAVDPTAGAFVSGPSHIKFIDSPTVAGTQRVRFQLVDNLSIEVLEFTEEASGESQLITGVHGLVYSNKDYNCQISAPDASWQITAAENVRPTITIKPRDVDAARFYLVMFPVPAGTAQDVVLNSRLSVIESRVKNFHKLREEQIELAGKLVPSVVFEFSHHEDENTIVEIVSENCIMIDGINGYLFKFTAEKKVYQEFKPIVEKIKQSFRLVK